MNFITRVIRAARYSSAINKAYDEYLKERWLSSLELIDKSRKALGRETVVTKLLEVRVLFESGDWGKVLPLIRDAKVKISTAKKLNDDEKKYLVAYLSVLAVDIKSKQGEEWSLKDVDSSYNIEKVDSSLRRWFYFDLIKKRAKKVIVTH